MIFRHKLMRVSMVYFEQILGRYFQTSTYSPRTHMNVCVVFGSKCVLRFCRVWNVARSLQHPRFYSKMGISHWGYGGLPHIYSSMHEGSHVTNRDGSERVSVILVLSMRDKIVTFSPPMTAIHSMLHLKLSTLHFVQWPLTTSWCASIGGKKHYVAAQQNAVHRVMTQ